MDNNTREQFGSRLGYILVSAGCAIGIGNVWKFPYICGQYGGAIFMLIYLPPMTSSNRRAPNGTGTAGFPSSAVPCS